MCAIFFFCFAAINVLYEINHKEKQIPVALISAGRNLSL